MHMAFSRRLWLGGSRKAPISNCYQDRPRFIAAFPPREAHRLISLQKSPAYFSVKAAGAPMADRIREYLERNALRIGRVMIASCHRDDFSLNSARER
jgi:hypothetical protein